MLIPLPPTNRRGRQAPFWIELQIDALPAAAELLADAFLAAGCRGVILDERPPGATRLLARVRGYWPAPQPGLPGLIRRLELEHRRCIRFGLDHATRHVHHRFVAEEDWAEGWKAHFQPVRIGRRLVIKPTWAEFSPAAGDLIIELDPGMAFGTGAHPTTRLCLEALEKQAEAGLGSVIDVGTGSGILAIAAARLGATTVLAIDNDPLTIPIAVDNARLNGVESRIAFAHRELAAVAVPAHLIVANILAETILELLPEVRRLLAPGGIFLGSGIIGERLAVVTTALESSGLRLVEVRREGDWCLVVATH